MLQGMPPISAADRDKRFEVLQNLSSDLVYDRVVKPDIEKMVSKVSGEMNKTLGQRPFRKV